MMDSRNLAKFLMTWMLFNIATLSMAKELKLDITKGGKSIEIFEPHVQSNVSYKGKLFSEVMDELFGPSWRKKEEVLFTCSDGYQPSIPVEKFLKHKAWLVWEKSDKGPFELKNVLHGGELVKLGPYYLIWENLNDQVIRELGANDFPYQIVSVDLISFKERFPKLAPAKNSKAIVREGFKLYRTHCMSCHAIDGEGGAKAPDLKAVGLFSKINEKILEKWLLDPASVKAGTTMPSFAPNDKLREKNVKKVIAYLKSKF